MYKFFILVASITFGNASMAQKKEAISVEKIPVELTSFININFPSNSILNAEIDYEKNASPVYDINLKDGTELEFNSAYQLIEIENKNGVSKKLIPEKILNYISKNYGKATIIEWSKGANQQEVELNNKVKLLFDNSDEFLSIKK